MGRHALVATALTVGTGVIDVTSFLRLGHVFSSVITGNLVLLGLAIGKGSADLGTHAAIAFAAYAFGVALGSWVGADERRVSAALTVQFGVVVLFTIGWELTDQRPAGIAQLLLLCSTACAMGIQSAVVHILDLGVSTTYLTGSLTAVIAKLARRSGGEAFPFRVGAALLALACGAALGVVLLRTVPAVVPAIPLTILAVITVRQLRS